MLGGNQRERKAGAGWGVGSCGAETLHRLPCSATPEHLQRWRCSGESVLQWGQRMQEVLSLKQHRATVTASMCNGQGAPIPSLSAEGWGPQGLSHTTDSALGALPMGGRR